MQYNDGDMVMSKEEKVCIYCGVPESQKDKIDLGFGKGTCVQGWEHIFVEKTKFQEVTKKPWKDFAKTKGW
jgi:hypothetical protein